jgi:phosphoglycolate phosphatase-like HAD superfamily hydrolase
MNKKTAVIWIRDGVLVNRMHINPVAFAFASWINIPPEHKSIPFLLEELINFGFAKSGFSAKEKMELFNEEKGMKMIDASEKSAADYNIIATEASLKADFFPGVVELLKALTDAEVLNFITSAVGQDMLDEWQKNDAKGKTISPYLAEILGARQNFVKGRDHFAYIAEKYGVGTIYYVADAVSEIETGKKFAKEFNITPIGFAHVITTGDILKGIELVRNAAKRLYEIDAPFVNPKKLKSQNKTEVKTALKKAGAKKIVTDGKNGIVEPLRKYLIQNMV